MKKGNVKLHNYIKSNLKKGFTKQQIKQVLLKADWKEQVIEKEFKNIKQL